MSDPRIKPRVPRVNPEHPLAKGLVGAWPMSDGGGNPVRDISGNGNNGVMPYGWRGWGLTKFGNAYTPDLWNAVEVGAIEDVGGTTAVTVSCIVKIISWASYAGVVGRENDSDTGSYWLIRAGTSHGFRWMLNTSGGWVYTDSIGEWKGYDVWYHMVGTYDGANARLYQDGVEIDSMAMTGTIFDTTMKLFFGSYDNGGGVPHGSRYITDGTIADVKIWRRCLQPGEVAALYYDPWGLYRSPEPVLANAPSGMLFEFDQLTGGMPDLRGGMV